MKTLVLGIALCLTAMAQDFHGVSIGGTTEAPTLENIGGKPVMAYTVKRHTTSGMSRTTTVPDVHFLVRGAPLSGPLGLFIGVHKGYVDHVTGKLMDEGDVTKWELVAVLFADGSFYGPSAYFNELSGIFYNFRSFARDLQLAGPTSWAATLNRTGTMIESLPKSGPISVNVNLMQAQEELSKAFLGLPAGELATAVQRVAALPDVVEGK
jgi:hypothetical protein